MSSDESGDPLDAFMAQNAAALEAEADQPPAKRPRGEAFEADDGAADFLEACATAAPADAAPVRDPVALLAAERADEAALLPFNKDFWEPVDPGLAAVTPADVAARRAAHGVRVAGAATARSPPVDAFSQLNLPPALARGLAAALASPSAADLPPPTPVQAAAIPLALAGRDVLALAPTGSGKTLAYLLPLCVHLLDQPDVEPGTDGPVAVVLVPTRELADQVRATLRALAAGEHLSVCLAVGGYSRADQLAHVRSGVDAVVGTPGRVADVATHPKAPHPFFNRTTLLVIDECDRLLASDFKAELNAIVGAIRDDRQTLMFSATLPPHVAALAAAALTDPVRVSVAGAGAAATTVTQRAVVLADDAGKQAWLLDHVPAMVDDGGVLIFVATRARCAAVAAALTAAGMRTVALHGDMDQDARTAALAAFASGAAHVAVATDLAARGLDVRGVATVVVADAAGRRGGGAAHVHRVGRTGRGGDAGVAWTLLTPGDVDGAAAAAAGIVACGGAVPPDVAALAAQARRGGGSGRNRGRGRGGRGGFVSGGVLAAGPAAVEVQPPVRLPPPPPMQPPPPPPIPAGDDQGEATARAIAAARAVADRIAAQAGEKQG